MGYIVFTERRHQLIIDLLPVFIAKKLGFENYLYLSRGESKDTGRARDLILANCFEAVIGAIYLDKGYQAAQDFLQKNLLVELPKIIEGRLFIDPTSSFQEISQERLGITPTYKVISESGPDHDKHFEVGAFIDQEQVGLGAGPSKQAAQIEAAANALQNKKWE